MIVGRLHWNTTARRSPPPHKRHRVEPDPLTLATLASGLEIWGILLEESTPWTGPGRGGRRTKSGNCGMLASASVASPGSSGARTPRQRRPSLPAPFRPAKVPRWRKDLLCTDWTSPRARLAESAHAQTQPTRGEAKTRIAEAKTRIAAFDFIAVVARFGSRLGALALSECTLPNAS
jgi:hypothetical protein